MKVLRHRDGIAILRRGHKGLLVSVEESSRSHCSRWNRVMPPPGPLPDCHCATRRSTKASACVQSIQKAPFSRYFYAVLLKRGSDLTNVSYSDGFLDPFTFNATCLPRCSCKRASGLKRRPLSTLSIARMIAHSNICMLGTQYASAQSMMCKLCLTLRELHETSDSIHLAMQRRIRPDDPPQR